MSDEKIEFATAELAKFEFRAGDTAVLMFPGKLSLDVLIRVKKTWEEFRTDIKCIVMDDGARLGVIRAAVTPVVGP